MGQFLVQHDVTMNRRLIAKLSKISFANFCESGTFFVIARHKRGHRLSSVIWHCNLRALLLGGEDNDTSRGGAHLIFLSATCPFPRAPSLLEEAKAHMPSSDSHRWAKRLPFAPRSQLVPSENRRPENQTASVGVTAGQTKPTAEQASEQVGGPPARPEEKKPPFRRSPGGVSLSRHALRELRRDARCCAVVFSAPPCSSCPQPPPQYLSPRDLLSLSQLRPAGFPTLPAGSSGGSERMKGERERRWGKGSARVFRFGFLSVVIRRASAPADALA